MKTTQAEHDAAVAAEYRRVYDETYERIIDDGLSSGWSAESAPGAAAHEAKRASERLAARLLRESMAG